MNALPSLYAAQLPRPQVNIHVSIASSCLLPPSLHSSTAILIPCFTVEKILSLSRMDWHSPSCDRASARASYPIPDDPRLRQLQSESLDAVFDPERFRYLERSKFTPLESRKDHFNGILHALGFPDLKSTLRFVDIDSIEHLKVKRHYYGPACALIVTIPIQGAIINSGQNPPPSEQQKRTNQNPDQHSLEQNRPSKKAKQTAGHMTVPDDSHLGIAAPALAAIQNQRKQQEHFQNRERDLLKQSLQLNKHQEDQPPRRDSKQKEGLSPQEERNASIAHPDERLTEKDVALRVYTNENLTRKNDALQVYIDEHLIEKNDELQAFIGQHIQEVDENVIFFRNMIPGSCGFYAILHGLLNGVTLDVLTRQNGTDLIPNLQVLGKSLNTKHRSIALAHDLSLKSMYERYATKIATQDAFDYGKERRRYICFVKSRTDEHLYELDANEFSPTDLGVLPQEEGVLGDKCLGRISELMAEWKGTE
jgi:hypothetical protein